MADNNYNPEYSAPINDGSTNTEEVPEKPYYDDGSAPPIPQMVNNYNQPPDYNNDLPSKENLQLGDQTNSPDVPYSSSQANNNYNYNYNVQYKPNNNDIEQAVPVRRKYRMGENPRTLMIMSIILILIVIANTTLCICFRIFSPFILADDIALLTMAIVYLILIAKRRPTNHPALGAVTVIVWFVGFGVKGFGMSQIRNGKVGFMVPIFVLTGGRAFAMFFCIPHTCNNYARR